jgi:hypothetical protein
LEELPRSFSRHESALKELALLQLFGHDPPCCILVPLNVLSKCIALDVSLDEEVLKAGRILLQTEFLLSCLIPFFLYLGFKLQAQSIHSRLSALSEAVNLLCMLFYLGPELRGL